MLRIDSHQHFWQYDPARHGWISESMKVIQRDFMPADLEPLLAASGIDGCVVVQVDQTDAETEFQLANANRNDFVKGVVGWVDLKSPEIEEKLVRLYGQPKLKGFRHILQGEANDAFMLDLSFKNGISKLSKYGFTYDILIFPRHMKNAALLIAQFPDQAFVIDHLAKPYIKDERIEEWKADIKAVAKYPNVYCKISGMVTEANWTGWKKADFRPYLDAAVEAFGSNRLMFGSDWPVCLCAASYQQVAEIVGDYFSGFSSTEKAAIWGGNATRFYNL